MAQQSYSFGDVYGAIGFSGVPLVVINGMGIGEITVEPANDNTMQEVAADGIVLTSKIKADNGTITITCFQTSPLHSALKKAHALLKAMNASAWNSGTITISSPSGLLDLVNATGVSFNRPATHPYQKQGQYVTWTFMAADIQYV
jgi:hypothetical protein